VVWAFDPLQATNASFNLAVLGATCRAYEVDLYGSRTDALNAGLATDRLLAEWSTREEPQPLGDAWPDAPDLVATSASGQPIGHYDAASDRARIEIPAEVARVKVEPALARAWQQHVRAAFQAAFAAGFVAVGFTRADPTRPRYLLHRRS
jgi:predicted GNAT superfamily acetyltransferase